MKRRRIVIALVVILLVLLIAALVGFIGVMAGWVDNPFSGDDEGEAGPGGFLRVPDTGQEPVFAMPLDDGTPAEVRFDSYTGVPAWVNGPIPAPAAASKQESAVKYFETNKELYQMAAPAEELAVGEVETDAVGMTHVSVDQVYKGVPVFGSDMKVHFSADGATITAVNGRYFPGIDIDVEPKISAEDAIAAAKEDLGIESAVVPENEPAELVVLTPVEQDVALTWKVQIIDGPNAYAYFVDANTSEIIFRYNDTKFLTDRYVYSADNKPDAELNHNKLKFVISNYNPTTTDKVAEDTYNNAGKVYDYFLKMGIDSYDNKGSPIVAIVHYVHPSGPNAFWDGTYLVFDDRGDRQAYGQALDIFTHEFTHAITDNTADLVYVGQSGAINESFSDVFACMTDRDDWLIADDLNNKPLRSLENPGEYNDPDHMSKIRYSDDEQCWENNDYCGVHSNSGIVNKAAYNAVVKLDSQQKEGRVIVEKIWFRALTTYLTKTAQFHDLRSACERAALDLYGLGSDEMSAVQAAFNDVGIKGYGPIKTWAFVAIDHDEPYGGFLFKKNVIEATIGVGDPENPTWEKTFDADNIFKTNKTGETLQLFMDISDAAAQIPPSDDNRWYLKIKDVKDDGKEGSITAFAIYTSDKEYSAQDTPVRIEDSATSYSYIPSQNAPPTEPDPVEIGGQSDTMLVMDVSGSMSSNAGNSGRTKMEAAKAGATNILSMVRDENLVQGGTHRLGLVSFTDSATLEQDLGGQYPAIEAAITSMGPQSGTNLGDGLQTGLDAMTGVTSARERIIIILSDGMSNSGMGNDEILNGPVAYARQKGIKVYTVGFGSGGGDAYSSDIDEEFLRQIASQTGGEYYYAEEYFELENVYIRLRQQSRGEVVATLSGTSGAEAQEAGAFEVKVENGELHGTVNWEEGQTDIVLVDPDGREVDSEYPGAYVFRESKPAYVVVKNPQPGTWNARVKSTEGAGGSYEIVVSAQEGTYRLEDYPWALAIAGGASLLFAAGIYGVFRRPIRVSWSCESCGTENLNEERVCSACGEDR